jgi:hypothetical protein
MVPQSVMVSVVLRPVHNRGNSQRYSERETKLELDTRGNSYVQQSDFNAWIAL